MTKEKQEEWAVKVKEFHESGQSQREWCRMNGEKRGTLRYWLERLDELSDGRDVVFAEVLGIGGDEQC